MFTKQMESLTDVMIEKEISKMEDKDVIVYGLSTGIELVFNIITTIILGLLFGLVLESFVFLVSFSFLRIYAGRYHCEKALNCYLISSGVVALVLALVKFIPQKYLFIIGVILLLLAVSTILKYAPVGSAHRDLDEEELVYFRKKMLQSLLVECLIITFLWAVRMRLLAFPIILGFVLIGIGVFIIRKYKRVRFEENNYVWLEYRINKNNINYHWNCSFDILYTSFYQ